MSLPSPSSGSMDAPPDAKPIIQSVSGRIDSKTAIETKRRVSISNTDEICVTRLATGINSMCFHFCPKICLLFICIALCVSCQFVCIVPSKTFCFSVPHMFAYKHSTYFYGYFFALTLATNCLYRSKNHTNSRPNTIWMLAAAVLSLTSFPVCLLQFVFFLFEHRHNHWARIFFLLFLLSIVGTAARSSIGIRKWWTWLQKSVGRRHHSQSSIAQRWW